jgi:hypothetical protein
MDATAANGNPQPQPQEAPQPDKRDRMWTIPTAFRLPSGEVIPDTRAMQEAMAELAPILTRLGGTVTIATRRVEVIPGVQNETSSIVVHWQAYSSRGGGDQALAEIPQMEPAP